MSRGPESLSHSAFEFSGVDAGGSTPSRHPRATRLPLRAPVEYEAPRIEPRHAITLNVSRSGVLIEHAADELPAGQVKFRLNFSRAGRNGLPDLICEGRVVRIEPASWGAWRVAMTIDHYESVWPSDL